MTTNQQDKMKIKSVHLKNFKRFSDLQVVEVPESAKIILIVGPNGSGKSSLFDGLLHWYRMNAQFGLHNDEKYFRKDISTDYQPSEQVKVELHGDVMPKRGSLYIRTAYRNDPDFSIGGINRLESPTDQIRFSRVIENDQTVSENYQRLLYDTMSAVYDSANDSKKVLTLREELIGEVRNSMKNVFGDLQLKNIIDPFGAGSFYFEKGVVESYHYKNLSGGEKSAFDLILDLHLKRKPRFNFEVQLPVTC